MTLLFLATLCIVLVGASEARGQRPCDDDASFDMLDSSVTALRALLAEGELNLAPDAVSTDQVHRDLVRLSQCEGGIGRRALSYLARLYGFRGETTRELETVRQLRERDLTPAEVQELDALYPPRRATGRRPATDSRASRDSKAGEESSASVASWARDEDDPFGFYAEPEEPEEPEEPDEVEDERPTKRRQARRVSRDAELPSLRLILETQISVSGADAYKRHKNMHSSWDLILPGEVFCEFDLWASSDDRTYSKCDAGADGVFFAGVDEGHAWTYSRENGAKLLRGPRADTLRLSADFDRSADPDRFQSAWLIGLYRFNGRRAWRVEAQLTERLLRTYYFDLKTGHLIGQEGAVTTRRRTRQSRTTFSRFFDVGDGLTLAWRYKIVTDGELTTARFRWLKWDVTNMPEPPRAVQQLLRDLR